MNPSSTTDELKSLGQIAESPFPGLLWDKIQELRSRTAGRRVETVSIMYFRGHLSFSLLHPVALDSFASKILVCFSHVIFCHITTATKFSNLKRQFMISHKFVS